MMPQSSMLHIFITGKLLCQLLLSASSLSCVFQQNYVAMEIRVFVSDIGHRQGLDLVCSQSYNIILTSIQSSFEVFISNIICNSTIHWSRSITFLRYKWALHILQKVKKQILPICQYLEIQWKRRLSKSMTRTQDVQHVSIQSVGDYSQNSNGNQKRIKTTITNNVKSHESCAENFLYGRSSKSRLKYKLVELSRD